MRGVKPPKSEEVDDQTSMGGAVASWRALYHLTERTWIITALDTPVLHQFDVSRRMADERRVRMVMQ